jgi:photosystem II stability/assembly factor-like uncharacterized protein
LVHKFLSISGAIILVLLLAQVSSSGFIVAEHTDDSNGTSTGAVWECTQFNPESSDLKLRDVKFINSTHGWIVGEDRSRIYGGVVLNTVDGGASWSMQLNNTAPYHEQICIVEGHIIWITGRSSLYYSLDWGVTWNESVVISESAGMSFVEFVNETHGWTASMGTLYKTTNAGLSWQEVTGWNFSGDMPREIHFISNTTAWAIGFFGIYYSSDGCDTWTQMHDYGGWAFSFVDSEEAWAVGDGMLAHMSDGRSWENTALPRRSPFSYSPPYFTDVLFLDESNGWIVGGVTSDPHVLYTPNGGRDWYTQSTSKEIIARLMAVDFINETHGWAVGYDGLILRTTHGKDLGTRLWLGPTDPIFLAYVSAIVGVSAVLAILVVRHFRRHRLSQSSVLTSNRDELV